MISVLGMRSKPAVDSRRLTFTSNEGDEFAHTLLHTLFRFFGDLGVVWEGIFHDPCDWSKIAYVSIVLVKFVGLVAFGGRGTSRLWRLGGGIVGHGRIDMRICCFRGRAIACQSSARSL